MTETAFDELASGYDDAFTHSAIGTVVRRAVWRRLEARFSPGDRVLELGCGTGEDALHLARRGVRVLATDLSRGMVETARRKAAAAGLSELVETRRMAIEELPELELSELEPGGAAPAATPAFDGVLSNFGALNCVPSLEAVGRELARLVRPGGAAVLCIMGPVVPWEWLWYLPRLDLARAFRRLRPGGVEWRGLLVRYPTIGRARRALRPYFRARRVAALGALVPPSYAEPWAARHPRLLAALDRWERRLDTVPPLPWLADHYLLELERTAERAL